MNRLLVAAIILLAIPSSASAYEQPTGSLCSNATTCFTPLPTDRYEAIVVDASDRGWGFLHTSTGHHSLRTTGCTYVWQSKQQWIDYGQPKGDAVCVYVGGEYVTHSYRRFAFPDIPAEDFQFFSPMMWAQHTQMMSGGEVVNTLTNIVLGGSQASSYCNFYRGDSEDLTVALDRAPNSVMAACGFTSRKSDAATPNPTPNHTTNDEIVVPGSAARCGSVAKVTVRSTRVKCASARSVIGRYARSLVSPAGWSCTAIVSDTGRRARCVRRATGKAVARAAIYGIWRA